MTNKNVKATQVEPKNKPQLMQGSDAVKIIPKPSQNGDADTPVQPKVGNAQPMGGQTTVPTSRTIQDTYSAGGGSGSGTNGYTSLNEQIWGDGGSGIDGYNQAVQTQQQTTGAAAAYDDEAFRQQLIAEGIDPAKMYEFSQKGGYTQDRDTALAGGGTGEPVDNFYRDGTWYYYEGKPRAVQAGTSGADAALMSDAAYEYIQYCKQKYAETKDPEEKKFWHNEAEKTRARAGYSGGVDGSMSIPLAQLQIEQAQQELLGGGGGHGQAGSSSGNNYPDTPEGRMQAYLDEWKAAAEKQANGQIDYAVEQAIKELERALEDAKPQFKEQAESISWEERQAMDNSALYAELRGDRGGIGQEQYNSIQNTAAQNRLAVQQAQTKLSTDTARQIADLRAQGEFEKADKALEITQQSLAQLITLEQWAAEFNLSQEQFQASLQQWEAEYNMAMQQIQMDQSRWEQEFAFNKEQAAISNEQWEKQYNAALDQWNKEFGYQQYLDGLQLQQNAKSEAAQIGAMWFELGKLDQITDEQLKALGFESREMAQAYYDAWSAAQSVGSGMDANTAMQRLFSSGYFTSGSDKQDIVDYLVTIGADPELAESWAGYYITVGYPELQRQYMIENDGRRQPMELKTGESDDLAKKAGFDRWSSMQGAAQSYFAMNRPQEFVDLVVSTYRYWNLEQANYFYELMRTNKNKFSNGELNQLMNVFESLSGFLGAGSPYDN